LISAKNIQVFIYLFIYCYITSFWYPRRTQSALHVHFLIESLTRTIISRGRGGGGKGVKSRGVIFEDFGKETFNGKLRHIIL